VRSHRRRSHVLDADHSDDDGPAVESDPAISLSEAEEAVSRAESRAEEARARAEELRRQAKAGSSDEADDETATVEGNADDADEAGQSPARPRRWPPRWRVRRPQRKTVGVSAAILLISTSLVASGLMLWQHISLTREHKRADEFADAARRGIELMMSIDPDHARENVQRLIDNTTGALQSQLRATSTFLVEDAQKAKVTTKATVQDLAVESMTGDSAVVLVVAESDTTNPDKSKRPPAFWRLSVDLKRDDGQLKMAKVDFVQ
jgi:Mce-associated membrane protein